MSAATGSAAGATALGVAAFAFIGAAGSTTGPTATALGVFDFVCTAGAAAFAAAFDFFGVIGLGGAIATRFAIRIVTQCLFSIFDFGYRFCRVLKLVDLLQPIFGSPAQNCRELKTGALDVS
jgi:hypothetical protein